MGKHKIAESPSVEKESPTKKKSKKDVEPEVKKEVKEDVTVLTQTETTGDGDVVILSEMTYTQKLQYASAIASPMAGKKLTKKLLKLVRKAYGSKNHVRSGLREVQMRIRKGERGLVVFAADVTPVDVMCHMPAVCEDLQIPYCYVPLRRDISDAMKVRRPTLMVLVVNKSGQSDSFSEYEDLYNECVDGVKQLPPLQ